MLPLIPIAQGIFLPSYFLLISIGFSVGLVYFLNRVSKTELSQNLAINVSVVLMVTGFIGSRLFHVFFEQFDYYLASPLKVFAIHEGGFVFFGGALLGGTVAVLFLKLQQQNIAEWLDLFAPVFPVVYAIGRFGTLLSGSGYGRPLDAWWAITYPAGSEAPANIALHPTPIYSIFWASVTWSILFYLERKGSPKNLAKSRGGFLFAVLVCLHAIGRFTIEQFRDDDRGSSLLGLSISSWICLVLWIGSIFWLSKKRPIKGSISSIG